MHRARAAREGASWDEGVQVRQVQAAGRYPPPLGAALWAAQPPGCRVTDRAPRGRHGRGLCPNYHKHLCTPPRRDPPSLCTLSPAVQSRHSAYSGDGVLYRVLRAAFVPRSLSIPSAVMASKRVSTDTACQFTFTRISSSALSGSAAAKTPPQVTAAPSCKRRCSRPHTHGRYTLRCNSTVEHGTQPSHNPEALNPLMRDVTMPSR